MPTDVGKYLGLFIAEASDHLDAFANDLLRLEKEPTPSIVDALFRHAHSVKGMAASLNLDAIASLAHRVEDLVDLLRSNPAAARGEIVDLLLGAHDDLAEMVKSTAAGTPPSEPGPYHARLGVQISALRGSAPAPRAIVPAVIPTKEDTPPATERTRFLVKVQISAQSPVPGVRAFLVHKKLSGLGKVLASVPSLDELKAGRLPGGLVAFEVESEAGDAAVQKALRSISDVASAEVIAALAQPPPAATSESKFAATEVSPTVRVRTEVLDRFLEDAGELLIVTARLREIGKGLPESHKGPFEEVADQIHGIAKELHDRVMSVRMTPLRVITDRVPRVVRDVAKSRNKDADVSVVGSEIELDRAILDQLADPILHVLRNAVDHGIEEPEIRLKEGKPRAGRITLIARRDRDKVVLEIVDDGRGMDAAALRTAAVARGQISRAQAAALTDRDALRLALLPGVSTARAVTEVSGRGVGLDVVARAVELVSGTLEIESTPGKGTRVVMRLPLTVAVVNVLLVGVGRELFGLPIGKVLQVVEADPETLGRSRRAPHIEIAGSPIPVRGLGELLGIPVRPTTGVKPFVVVDVEPGNVALEVDRLFGQQEAVLKPLSRPLDRVSGLSGVTILGTGRPVFILDVPRLLAA
jgi:two-component system, chemotaxis family, sensor kinase CheA